MVGTSHWPPARLARRIADPAQAEERHGQREQDPPRRAEPEGGGQEDLPGRERIALVPGPPPDAVEVDLAGEVAEGVLRVVGEEVAELAWWRRRA